MARIIAVSMLITMVFLFSGCKTQEAISVGRLEEIKVAAPLTTRMDMMVKEIAKDHPEDKKIAFLAEAIQILLSVTGYAEPIPETKAALQAIAREFTKVANMLQKERDRVTQEIAKRDKLIKEYEEKSERFAWSVLGIAGIVILGLAALIWFKTGSLKVIFSFFLIAGIPFSIAAVGLFYEYHRTSVIAGAIIILIAVAVAVFVGKLLRNDTLRAIEKDKILKKEILNSGDKDLIIRASQGLLPYNEVLEE
jgi:hypothetical protein